MDLLFLLGYIVMEVEPFTLGKDSEGYAPNMLNGSSLNGASWSEWTG